MNLEKMLRLLQVAGYQIPQMAVATDACREPISHNQLQVLDVGSTGTRPRKCTPQGVDLCTGFRNEPPSVEGTSN